MKCGRPTDGSEGRDNATEKGNKRRGIIIYTNVRQITHMCPLSDTSKYVRPRS